MGVSEPTVADTATIEGNNTVLSAKKKKKKRVALRTNPIEVSGSETESETAYPNPWGGQP